MNPVTATEHDLDPVTFPIPRESECPFDPVPEYAQLREAGVPVQVECPSGVTAWLVTRYEDAREVMGSSDRFGNASGSLAHVLVSLRPDAPMVEGNFTCMDGDDHHRFKRVLGAELWSIPRMEALRPAVQRIIDEQIEKLASAGMPVDWYGEFAMPVTTLVLSELLGVPYEGWELVEQVGTPLSVFGTHERGVAESLGALLSYLHELVGQRRAHPEDDFLSRLLHHEEAKFTNNEVAMVAAGLLIAGHDSAASAIAYSTLALLEHPDQLKRLQADRTLLPNAVEELVRYLANGMGFSRLTTRNTELGGQPIAVNEYVVLAMQAANRDPALYSDPDVLDIGRKSGAHLAFGHGLHRCLGQQIARLLLTVIIDTVLRRVPSFRLAVPLSEIEFKLDAVVRGPARLPVAWDGLLPRDA